MDVRQDSYHRLQEYTNQIENMYSSLRSFKHDYSNILLSMSGYYVFIISNSFLEKGVPYASLAQPNVSTKGANRGLGLYNAHEIIAKYNSVFLDTEIQGEHFVQRLRIT